MLVERVSTISGKKQQMDLDVTPEQIARWQRGELAQVAFAHLPAAEREFLISGITPEEWTNTFGTGGP